MLKAIKTLLGINNENVEQSEIRKILSQVMGKEVKQGNTGYTDGYKIYDRDEEG